MAEHPSGFLPALKKQTNKQKKLLRDKIKGNLRQEMYLKLSSAEPRSSFHMKSERTRKEFLCCYNKHSWHEGKRSQSANSDITLTTTSLQALLAFTAPFYANQGSLTISISKQTFRVLLSHLMEGGSSSACFITHASTVKKKTALCKFTKKGWCQHTCLGDCSAL